MARTPGPWHTGGIFNPDSERPTMNVWGPTADGMQSGQIIATGASIDDAHLIAAAPDFSAASQSTADRLHDLPLFLKMNGHNTLSEVVADELAKHEAALAKARGESQ